MDSVTREIRAFAVRAHGDQMYGDRPYVAHLDDVAAIARQAATNSDEQDVFVAVAYLHDVLEDTEVGPDELREKFGDLVAEAVSAITDPPGKDRKERKAVLHWRLEEIDHSSAVGRAALVVKTADRLANVRACVVQGKEGLLGMYVGEHLDFRRAVHRRGLCDELWKELDAIYMARR